MTYPVTLTSMFQSVGLVYGLSLPLIILVLFIIVALPAIMRSNGRAEWIYRAAYCYLAQMLGILLMTAGALPALYAVFSMQPLSQLTYVGLLLVFAVGGVLFLWNDSLLRDIDIASKAIPGALFLVTWKFVGLLVTVFSGLSLVLRLMLIEEQQPDWWIIHMIMLLYGLLISWFTLHRPIRPSMLASSSTNPHKKPALKKKK